MLLSFTLDELERMARDTTDFKTQARALCAIGLLDQEREASLRRELSGEEERCES